MRRESRSERRGKLSTLFPLLGPIPLFFAPHPLHAPRLNPSRISTLCAYERIFMPPRSSKRLASWPKLALLINRNYTLLWLGGTISLLVDILFTMMLILLVGTRPQNQGSSPLAVTRVLLSAPLPPPPIVPSPR